MQTFLKKSLFLLLSIIVLHSCTNSKYPGYTLTDRGVYYKVHEKSADTLFPQTSDYVTLTMNYGLSDTMLFESKNLDTKLVFPMIEPMFEGDLYEALKLMSPGDSMSFVIVADSFFLITSNMPELPDYVVAGEPMYYDVKLLNVQTNQQHQLSLIEEQNAKHKKEISDLLKYVRKNKIETAPLENGLYFIEQKTGKGIKADTGDICKISLSVSELNGKQLFTNFNTTNYLNIEFGKEFDTPGFMQGLGMMREGGKAKLIVPSRIGVGAYGMQGVDGFTTLSYEIELIEVTPYAELVKQREAEEKQQNANRQKITAEEKARLITYLKQNNISQSPLASGMYYIETQKGSGKQATHGNTVKVHYKLFNIDGKLLNTSYDRGTPLEFVLGTGAVIEGWELGIKQMNEGGSATLIIPSNMAYGKNGKGDVIPPNSTLIFEVKLVSVK